MAFIDRVLSAATAWREQKRRDGAQSSVLTIQQGYEGAQDSRNFDGKAYVTTFPTSEDWALTPYFRDRLRLEIRALRRNNPIVAGAVKRFASNIVGHGITPEPKTSNPEWNKAASHYFHQWAKVADFRRRLSFWDMQQICVADRMVDGDSFYEFIDNGQLLPRESETCVEPPAKFSDWKNHSQGIDYDAAGVPVRFYFAGRNNTGFVDVSSSAPVDARNIVHVWKPFRIDQGRGVPELAPVVTTLSNLKTYTDATLNKAMNDAKLSWLVWKEGGISGAALGLRQTNPPPSGQTQTVPITERIENGSIKYLSGSGRVESFESKTPNSMFPEFTNVMLMLIASCIEIPRQFLVMDFETAAFSSSRAALMQTYSTFESWQDWLNRSFNQRVWNWCIAKAIKAKQLPSAPIGDDGISEWYKVEWNTPEYDWIDPQAQAQSDMVELSMGKRSLNQVVRKTGRTTEAVFDDTKETLILAHRKAEEANKEVGASVFTWRNFTNVAAPGAGASGAAPSASPASSDSSETPSLKKPKKVTP